jgi:hypothetical protein
VALVSATCVRINLHRDTIVPGVGVANETSGIKLESSSTSMSIGSGTVSEGERFADG